MRFVNEKQIIPRKKVQQGVGGGTGRTAGKHTGIVFDTGAVPHLPKHLKIVFRALLDALCFQQFALAFEIFHTGQHFRADLGKRLFPLFVRHGIMRGRKDPEIAQFADHLSADGAELHHTVDFVPEEFHPHRRIGKPGGIDIHRVAPHAELVPHKVEIAAFVLDGNQPPL